MNEVVTNEDVFAVMESVCETGNEDTDTELLGNCVERVNELVLGK